MEWNLLIVNKNHTKIVSSKYNGIALKWNGPYTHKLNEKKAAQKEFGYAFFYLLYLKAMLLWQAQRQSINKH